MTDRYATFARSGPGRFMIRRLGLPDPPRLRRYQPGEPLAAGPVLVGGAGRVIEPVRKLLQGFESGDADEKHAALDFDASGIADCDNLRGLFDFFHPVIRSLTASGRVIVFGTPPEACTDVREATAQRALEGFVRSVAKELSRGSTAQLVYVMPGGEDAIDSTVRFLLSGRSAYVDGQVIRIGPATIDVPD